MNKRKSRPPASTPMPPTRFILGDWGTSRLRLYLCERGDSGIRVLGTATGPGVKDTDNCQAAFVATAAALPAHPAPLEVVLGGMAGSNIGWLETEYVPCPAGWLDLYRHSRTVSASGYKVHIVAGVAGMNRFQYFDAMRGEEVQILGWAANHDYRLEAERLVCLPGTHTKWVTIDGTGILNVDTTVQGELFDVLNRHSILAQRDMNTGPAICTTTFLRAVDLLRDNTALPLLQALFSTRSLQLGKSLAAIDAGSYLSGLLVGADVRDMAVSLIDRNRIRDAVVVIGEPSLTALYATALERFGIGSERYSGTDAVIAGLGAWHAQLAT